jgi:hypothetical protein
LKIQKNLKIDFPYCVSLLVELDLICLQVANLTRLSLCAQCGALVEPVTEPGVLDVGKDIEDSFLHFLSQKPGVLC